MQRIYLKAASILVFALVATTVFAHDTWLLPKAFRIQAERPTMLALTSGMAFPLPVHAITQDRVQQATMRLAGETSQLNTFAISKKSLNLSVNASNVGVAVVSVALKPRTLELSPKLVQEYLTEIGASDSLKAAWKKPSAIKWRETYTKHSKTFIGVGEERFFRGDSSWKDAQGLTLEIIPEKHPCLLRRGDELPVRILLAGKPAANFPLGIVHSASKQATLQRTDADGRTIIKLTKAARYLIRGTSLRPSSTKPDEWESDFTTMTLEVR